MTFVRGDISGRLTLSLGMLSSSECRGGSKLGVEAVDGANGESMSRSIGSVIEFSNVESGGRDGQRMVGGCLKSTKRRSLLELRSSWNIEPIWSSPIPIHNSYQVLFQRLGEALFWYMVVDWAK